MDFLSQSQTNQNVGTTEERKKKSNTRVRFVFRFLSFFNQRVLSLSLSLSSFSRQRGLTSVRMTTVINNVQDFAKIVRSQSCNVLLHQKNVRPLEFVDTVFTTNRP